MDAYLGVDVGATAIRAVVGDGSGRFLGRDRRPTPADRSGDAVVEAVREAVLAACSAADVDPTALVAAGVGAVGPLDREAGAAIDPPNLPGVDRLPLVDPLASLCSTDRVVLHNDATAGAVGERFFGDGGDHLVYLTLSTGVGAGAVVDGHPLAGWRGNAAEVGHLALDPDGRPCGCGGAGHWEAYCGGAHVADYARELHDGEATALPIDDPGFDAADLFGAAGEDPLATRVVDRIGEWNAAGVAAVVHAYAPRTVVVGGGVAINHPDRVLDPIRAGLPDRVATAVPTVRLTDAGDDAVVRGALAAALGA